METGDLSNIQGVDNDIKEFIAQIEKGNVPNPNKLLKIEKELKGLVNSKNIPFAVKQNLQFALQSISSEEEFGVPLNIESLYKAKSMVDQALEEGQQNQ